jgi:hypothetical protein
MDMRVAAQQEKGMYGMTSLSACHEEHPRIHLSPSASFTPYHLLSSASPSNHPLTTFSLADTRR